MLHRALSSQLRLKATHAFIISAGLKSSSGLSPGTALRTSCPRRPFTTSRIERVRVDAKLTPRERHSYSWDSIDPETRELWGRLGWHSLTWNMGALSRPFGIWYHLRPFRWSNRLFWVLHPTHQDAATKLGYVPHTYHREVYGLFSFLRDWCIVAVGALVCEVVMIFYEELQRPEREKQQEAKRLQELQLALELPWQKLKITEEERKQVRSFILQELSRHNDWAPRAEALDEPISDYLCHLRDLFAQLAMGGHVITRSSWAAALRQASTMPHPKSAANMPTYNKASYGYDGKGWEMVELNQEVPSDLETRDDIARWVKQREPNAVGFTCHPRFPRERYVTAILKEGQRSVGADSWPLYLYTTDAEESATVRAGPPRLASQERAIADLMFRAADLDEDDEMDFEEFVTFAVLMAEATKHDAGAQTKLLFRLVDTNHDGMLSRAEVTDFVELCAKAGVAKYDPLGPGPFAKYLVKKDPEALAARLFELGDENHDGVVSEVEFNRVLGPYLLGHLDLSAIEVHSPEKLALATTSEQLELTRRRPTFDHLLKVVSDSHDLEMRRRTPQKRRYTGGGCFAAGTKVRMADGRCKPIEALGLGDLTAGGRIVATLQFDATDAAPLVDYKGVLVTSDHAVREADQGFLRVRDSAHGRPVESGLVFPVDVVYDVISSGHRIIVQSECGKDVVFADYIELPYNQQLDVYDIFLERLNENDGRG